MVGTVSASGVHLFSDLLLNSRQKNSGHVGHTWTGQCSPQHVRTRLTMLRGWEGDGVQPEGDVHSGA